MLPRAWSVLVATTFLCPALAGAQAPRLLACSAPDEVHAGTEILVRCEANQGLIGAHTRLHYRPSGSEEFTSLTMDATADGVEAKVPAAAVRGGALQFFVQATDVAGSAVLSSGRNDSPNLVRVRAAPAAQGGLAAVAADPDGPGRRPGAFWLGLGMGSGYGWQPATRLEHRSDLQADAGFAPAALGHLAPEVGYQIAPHWAVSLAGRHQFVPADGDDPGRAGAPRRWAHAVLLRGHYTFERGPLLLFGVGQLGGGDGYRFRFAADRGGGRLEHDTTRAGPLLLGPGAGAAYRFARNVAAVAQLDLLIGAPDFGAVTDLNLGIQVDL